MIKPKAIQPDGHLQKIKRLVDAKCRDGAMVNFYRLEWPDGRMQVGVQFSFMGHTSTKVVDDPPDEKDVNSLVAQINSWIESVPRPDKWTTDQAEADSLDWNR